MSRTDWMAGKYGLMVHYLPVTPEGIDAAVNSFQLDRFVADFEATGAEWLIFTLGQNTGNYNSPNRTIEHYAGFGHCSRRDLARELAEALHRRGKRFIAYLPCELHWNQTLQDGFGWQRHADATVEKTFRQELFQSRWHEVIREWALRFGEHLDGWWFDGIHAIQMTAADDADWRAAARAGNPAAAVCFNYAGFDLGIPKGFNELDDYYSGEATILLEGLPFFAWRGQENSINHDWWAKRGLPFAEQSMFCPGSTCLPGTRMRYHVLTPLDAFWFHGGNVDWLKNVPQSRYSDPATLPPGEMELPLYPDAELQTLLAAFTSVGGGVTLNVGIHIDGALGEKTLAQLKRIKSDQPMSPAKCPADIRNNQYFSKNKRKE